jgi:hypothetical protein
MRRLKDGTVKYKASAYKEGERLAKDPFPLPHLSKGTTVKVYMGCGYSKGQVIHSDQTSCSVRLVVGNRTVVVRDARSIIVD